ncbi:hypothetical protein DY000_02036194 [Brassica cretica]|uniref:DUF4283 domain-containing protein n=1 Tax=Brassica cretica TaxID=69181 RepID=A0ABQ7BR87_BRACR|nr:hypothetical protein DY000_02036194 [Brassica cretica]
MFHTETRNWIIQQSVWHVDDCLMFVAPWNSVGTLKIPEISIVPAWVTKKYSNHLSFQAWNFSHCFWPRRPMFTHKPRLDPLNIGEAKILVEIELDKNFPKQIAVDDKLETSSTSTDSLSPQVSSSLKESSTAFAFLRSSSDAKSTPASTLAGSSSVYTTSQVIDDVPSNIIMNEGITLSGNDLLIMTPFTTEYVQEHVNMESDFHTNEQMDEFGSVSRGGRLIKSTQKYQ